MTDAERQDILAGIASARKHLVRASSAMERHDTHAAVPASLNLAGGLAEFGHVMSRHLEAIWSHMPGSERMRVETLGRDLEREGEAIRKATILGADLLLEVLAIIEKGVTTP